MMDPMMEEEERKSPSSVVSDSSDHDSSEPETELMVTSRIRRVTAGNRYSNVVAQEQAAEDGEEDDVALLFAEIEGEDEEYQSDEGADEADMSSSDDDDQGPNAAADDMEGEQELQREAKAERAKKRKADLALTSISGLRKRPKIDPTALRRAPVPKPSKRKERVSWLPDEGFAPGRTSLRKQTLEHRAETHAKLKKNEQQRLKAKKIRAERVKEREADAPKELTQADRLIEAERVERRNAKSLNRWEATERRRQEEQAAKLAALKERKLEGAVISARSARHVFRGWRNSDNPDGEVGEVKKRGRKSKAYLEQLAAAKLLQEPPSSSVLLPQQGMHAHQSASEPTNPSGNPALVTLVESNPPNSETVPPQTSSATGHIPSEQTLVKSEEISETQRLSDTDLVSKPGSASNLTTPTEIAQEKLMEVTTIPVPGPDGEQKTDEVLEQETQQDQEMGSAVATQEGAILPIESQTISRGQDDLSEKAIPTPAEELHMPSQNGLLDAKQTISTSQTASNLDVTETTAPNADTDDAAPLLEPASSAGPSADLPAHAVEQPPAPEVISIRNLIVLENFDGLSSQARNEYGFFYSTRKTTSRPTKHVPELCLITGLPVRYRDPVTGLGYHNASAFKKLKELRNHKFVWSSMLGCYAGRSSLVARGVPEGFNG